MIRARGRLCRRKRKRPWIKQLRVILYRIVFASRHLAASMRWAASHMSVCMVVAGSEAMCEWASRFHMIMSRICVQPSVFHSAHARRYQRQARR